MPVMARAGLELDELESSVSAAAAAVTVVVTELTGLSESNKSPES